MKVYFVLGLIGLALGAKAETWGYVGDNGVNTWNSISSFCAGSRQSPIDIPYDLTFTNFSAFNMTGYDSMQTGELEIANNGHTAVVSIKEESIGKTYMEGGGLNGTYLAVQFHFHWGRNDTEGSEHTFRGRSYPLEVHFVHMKRAYGNLSEALKYGDGLAVLGFFFVPSDMNNTKLDPLITALENIRYKGQNKSITINLEDVMADKMDQFYRYDGSLTTPSCNEAVVWTVFENKIHISPYQLAQFRTLFETDVSQTMSKLPMLINYRPVQNLNTRKVHKNYEDEIPAAFHWSYHGYEGPDYWSDYYSTCTGERQSPINLPQADDLAQLTYDENLESLQFTNYDKPITGTITNNGHTIQVDLTNTDIYLEKGGLSGRYRAAQFHFHWGPDNMHGSEHTVHSKSHPMELHIVHYKEDYQTLKGALEHPDGLAVLGVFIKAGETNNNYAHVISKLPDVKYNGANKAFTNVGSLQDLIVPQLKTNASTGIHVPFYRYNGGLTTPPCSEIVTWNVLTVAVPISSEQIAAFRNVTQIVETTNVQVMAKDYIVENFRPTQHVASRPITVSYNFIASGVAGLTNSVLLAIILMLVVLKLVQ